MVARNRDKYAKGGNMRKQDLFRSAAQLVPPPAFAIAAYKGRRDHMTSKVTHRLLSHPDLDVLIGPGNRGMMEDSLRNHARFMESLFLAYDHRMFVETLLWVYRAFRAHGFTMAYWNTQIAVWQSVLEEELPAEVFEEIRPFYDWMAKNHDAFGILTTPPPVTIPSHAIFTSH
jgi:hypothetical protein